jgi:hypothetical protein
MTSTTWRRTGALSGLAFVVLTFAGNAIATSGTTVDSSSSGPEILADLRAHDTVAAAAGTIMEGLGLLALLCFVAFLGGHLRRAEEPDAWLASAASHAGLLTIAVKLTSAPVFLAAVWRLDALDPTTARTLVDINGAAFVLSWATMGAFAALTAASALRSGVLPRRLAGIGAVAGGAAVVLTPLGPDGPGVLGFLLSVLWLAAVSVVLARRPAAEEVPRTALAPALR